GDAEARAELSASGDDAYRSGKSRERIGKLSGTAAVIRVGAATASERTELKLRVDAALASARLALQQGVVPGGGAALLACTRGVESLDLEGDEAVGAALLARALAEPMRAIAANAGFEPCQV